MIQKILNNEQEKSYELLDSISEVKLIMNEDSTEDTNLIFNAFPNSSNSISLTKNEENSKVKKLAEEHGESVYTKNQIKTICMKYRLKFLPSTVYKANVPIEAIHKLKEVCKNNKRLTYLLENNSYFYEKNIFILAPSAMFNISSNIQKAKDENQKMREMKKLREQDPALFIKLEDDKYLFIKEWGNSFSPFRRILGALTARISTLNIIFFLSWLIFISLSVKGAFKLNDLFTPDERGVTFLYGLSVFIYCTILATFSISWMLNGENGFVMSTFKSYKHSFWKIKNIYATENNWNES